MSRKQFTTEDKIKYINLIKKYGIDYALIEFICEFEDRYLDYLNCKGTKRKDRLPTTLGKQRLNSWWKKYNIGDMKSLESKTGKKKGIGQGRPKRTSINELNEHDRDLYQDIMEEVLRDHGIKPSIIQDKIKERKDKNNKFDNHKKACMVMEINRTSIYKINIIKTHKKETKINRLWVPGLSEDMCLVIIKSDYTIGRDKLFKTMINNGYNISSYIFRVHFEAMEYKSRSYIRKGNRAPKENKYNSVWANDYVDGKFKSDYPGEVIHADIKYIKFQKEWWYLHTVIETYANKVLAWSLSKERTSNSSIALVSETITKLGYAPRVFHSDHGIEYANYNFKHFLEQKGILQSMSRKGHSLGNRPSEYWFAQIQREKLDFYNILDWNYNEIYNLINNYVEWYNLYRVQSNLQYKTPQDTFVSYGVCV